MARCLKSFLIYSFGPAHYNSSLTFYLPLKNNTQSYVQTKIKPFYCTKFVIAPAKGSHLVREMQECTAVLFHRKKTKRNHKNVRKTYY